ncbi:hypothetical protein GKIL_3664 [Gloeobacter kilaueensis JS1]|uniref:Uncharacterized protein n=1 Tax=Gloeobacter kilaueensis (strain ATCC BAA-2537 / CCAP 1431/1 / ULC 316 / JS1) TaxID=1183438 RepID=U5QQF1_GLOK1|nr:hypothetical protein GKIL_3664 [Gloeobacter kilaueensis JS1]
MLFYGIDEGTGKLLDLQGIPAGDNPQLNPRPAIGPAQVDAPQSCLLQQFDTLTGGSERLVVLERLLEEAQRFFVLLQSFDALQTTRP